MVLRRLLINRRNYLNNSINMSLGILDEEIVIASHNSGKIKEFRDLFKKYKIKIKSASDFNIVEPEETGSTFSDNALIKARETTKGSGQVSIADDSGLCVNALDGDPGIYSARWAGEDKNFSRAIDIIKDKLESKKVKKTKAHFVCSLAVVWPNQQYKVYEGKVYGKISFPPRGNNGFGYDPIFIPNGYKITFGEMDPSEKHSISHRANAFNLLKLELLNDR